MNVKFRLDVTAHVARLKDLGARGPAIAARAINRTAAAERTQAKRAIAADTGLRAKDVDAALQLERATPNRLQATVSVSGRRIPLIAFGARGPEPSRGRGRGVSYSLPKGRGRHPQAFIATMKSGRRGVFVRTTPRRLPITELYGPSLPKSFENTYLGNAPERAQATLVKNLEHELSFALKK